MTENKERRIFITSVEKEESEKGGLGLIIEELEELQKRMEAKGDTIPDAKMRKIIHGYVKKLRKIGEEAESFRKELRSSVDEKFEDLRKFF
jgi:hypothetical protein